MTQLSANANTSCKNLHSETPHPHLQEDVRTRTRTIASLQGIIKAKDQHLIETKAKIREVTCDLGKYSDVISEKNKEMDRIKNTLKKMERDQDHLKKDVDRAQAMAVQLLEEYNSR